jgi:hypothetical protein
MMKVSYDEMLHLEVSADPRDEELSVKKNLAYTKYPVKTLEIDE